MWSKRSEARVPATRTAGRSLPPRAPPLLPQGRPRLCLRRGQRRAGRRRDDVRDAIARAEALTARASPRFRRHLRRLQAHQEHSCARPRRRDLPFRQSPDVRLSPEAQQLADAAAALAPEVRIARKLRGPMAKRWRDRHSASGRGRLLRQGDGARSRSRRARRESGLIDECCAASPASPTSARS
jgi:hypothetical protein